MKERLRQYSASARQRLDRVLQGPREYTEEFLASRRGKIIIAAGLLLLFIPFLIPPVLLIYLAVRHVQRELHGTVEGEENKVEDEEETEPKTSSRKRAIPVPKLFHRKMQPPDMRPSETFTESEDGIWISRKKQLEQIECLKKAGILSPEEYKAWKKRIQDNQL